MVNKKAIDFFSAMEQFLYQHADPISIISESYVHLEAGQPGELLPDNSVV